ncbi:metal-sensitive transcriptional regulator [Desulfoscipio geothermicus]|uniref:DNA-binding transcriptional regulator, FrmR family n=1 Tax=Desulfoscipio geothermicus DSM 3669 TaxID=1121426 RepID=A0A1I6DYV3_9FIRM|nr:metal-sensitive transcriptional regulator [Desulfoscipio geothermicus]SFR10606.1 DNA-binding transcriptional regulator, FrmR family [Desulfoscipio geothermicus DSM 3669]
MATLSNDGSDRHGAINEDNREARQHIPLERDPATMKEMMSRLKKIEGQVRGVQKMVQDCRDCGDIVIQLAAIKAAVNRVGITMLACHLADQIKNDQREGRNIKESLQEFIAIFKKFS